MFVWPAVHTIDLGLSPLGKNRARRHRTRVQRSDIHWSCKGASTHGESRHKCRFEVRRSHVCWMQVLEIGKWCSVSRSQKVVFSGQ